jgi:hypothetical protein
MNFKCILKLIHVLLFPKFLLIVKNYLFSIFSRNYKIQLQGYYHFWKFPSNKFFLYLLNFYIISEILIKENPKILFDHLKRMIPISSHN